MSKKVLTTLLTFATSLTVFAADYELTVDGDIYMFTQGVKRNITLNDGRQISVSVAQVKTKEFREHGFSFKYPSELKLSQESFYGIKQVTVEAMDSSMLIMQIFPAGISPTEVQRDLLNSFREEFASIGARFPSNSTESCKRKIGGAEHQGVKLFFALGGIAHESEIYAMTRGNKTLAFYFQYAVEDKEQAFPRFETITSTFK